MTTTYQTPAEAIANHFRLGPPGISQVHIDQGQTIIDTLTAAGFAVVRLPEPTSFSEHRQTWEGPVWQIDSHTGGHITLTTCAGEPDEDRLPLIYDLGAACIAAARYQETER